jgi:S-adenosylmethionine:diacylglycerol 3-amino-3-carboxypropyl transferase
MKALFDFGISQEDPLTEQKVLDIHPHDRILSVASGGEIALSLISLNNDIRVSAVDVSENQIRLCRLKLAAAMFLDFPVNGMFLGYAKADKLTRVEWYHSVIRPQLSASDATFWDENLSSIANGIVNAGRFEQYIKKMRFVATLFVGKKNLRHLISFKDIEEQQKFFQKHIASRKSLQWLFRIAFHPLIYRKHGLQEQALIHAHKNVGERFFKKFRNFCTSGLASKNYFLQYFLLGNCNSESFPEYLQPENKARLMGNLSRFRLSVRSVQEELSASKDTDYNKLHISNMGDWLTEEQFLELLTLIKSNCKSETKICHRHLQKNHFLTITDYAFSIGETNTDLVEEQDRFPFYGILSISVK